MSAALDSHHAAALSQIAGMKNCCLNGKCQHSQLQNLMEMSNISEEASPVFISCGKNLDLKNGLHTVPGKSSCSVYISWK